MVYDYHGITEELLSTLKPRTREVLVRRFGLESGEKETLQAIGGDHGVTRERIRQIENAGLNEIKPSTQNYQSVYEFFENQLQIAGGLRKEEMYLPILGPETEKNYIFFLLVLEENFKRLKETNEFHTLWTNNPGLLKQARETLDYLIKKIEEKGEPMPGDELEGTLEMDPLFLFGLLSVSKPLARGPRGKWGLSAWSTISPRGTKDRSYIVLREKKKPLHFREIAEIINKGGLFRGGVNIHPQTVHNELIKHPEFVLVGRGTYGLKEWGYEPGTVKEVIKRVLQKGGPMKKEDLVSEVLDKRLVKRNTVLLNLRSEEFIQDKEGRYMLASS